MSRVKNILKTVLSPPHYYLLSSPPPLPSPPPSTPLYHPQTHTRTRTSGAPLLQTPFAARERLRKRLAPVELVLDDVAGDGNCFYRAIAIILIDLGLCEVSYHHWNVRADLADFLFNHQSDHLDDSGGTIAAAALNATHDWKQPPDLANDEEWRPQSIDQVPRPVHQTLPTHTQAMPP